jgi:HEAT repeat protein
MPRTGLFRVAIWWLIVGLPAAAAEPPPPTAPEALAAFQVAWRPLSGNRSMRPLDDAGWKKRFETLRHLAHCGDASVRVLSEALRTGDDDLRVFAAQALSLLPHADARPSLLAALNDKHAAVRLYALDALSMLGKVPDEDPFRALMQKDPNRDVRAHAACAIDRDEPPQPDAIARALRDYDPKQLATAVLGQQAPDFQLQTPTGAVIRLSQFRGQQPVVLVFVYGDT